MIGHCHFEWIKQSATTGADVIQKTIRPWEDYGLYLVSYDSPPPKPRIYRATIEGRDGTLDMSEWEGRQAVRYNDRQVKISFRDLGQNAQAFMAEMLGRKFYIHFDDDPDHYYRGRCEQIDSETRQHVTNMDCLFVCHPFRYSAYKDVRTYTVEPRTSDDNSITIAGQNVIPEISVSGIAPGSFGSYISFSSGDAFGLYNGVSNTDGLILYTGTTDFTIWNANTSGDIDVSISWRPEVI